MSKTFPKEYRPSKDDKNSVPATVKKPLLPDGLYDLMWVNPLPKEQRASKVALTKSNILGNKSNPGQHFWEFFYLAFP
jgi:hypothetical protein